MSQEKILTELPTLTSVADGDLFYVVDVSDTTDSAAGSSKQVTAQNLFVYAATAGETAAAVTIVNYNHPPGNVLRYGTNTTPGTTDMLAAFDAAHDQFTEVANADFGGEIIIPEGIYYLSDTWHIDRQVHIYGAGSGARATTSGTRLVFAAEKDGIWFHSSVEPGFGQSYNSTIEDLFIDGGGKAGTNGHGVAMTARAHASRVHVQDFAENGFYIFGGAVNTTGDPNQWTMRDCDAIENGGHGIYVDGPDTNAGFCSGCNFKSNDGWGIYDSSFLGNTYIGCHINDNDIGSIKTEGQVNDCLFLGIYIEVAANYGVELDNPTQWYGGQAVGVNNYPFITISGDGTGATARTVLSGGAVSAVQVTAQGSGYTTATAAVPTGKHGSGSGATFTPVISGGKIVSVTVDAGGSGYAGQGGSIGMLRNLGTPGGWRANEAWFRKRQTSLADGYVKMGAAQDALISMSVLGGTTDLNLVKWDAAQKTYNITTGNSDAAANIGQRIASDLSTGQTGGRSAALTQGSVMYPRGLWLGDSSTGRNISAASAKPSSGEYAEGDFVFNTNAAPLATNQEVLLGWSRQVTGTSHALDTDWVACYAATTATVTATTTQLADIAHAINTTPKKVAGQMIFNTTTGAPVWSVGSADGSLWNNATGATAHTPV